MLKYINRVLFQVDYVKKLGLAGLMVWSFDLDDFAGQFCGKGKYPLLKTIAQSLRDGTDHGPNEEL